MLKIIYKQEPYDYEGVGRQVYDIDTTITIDNNATLNECLAVFIRALKIATYHPTADNLRQAIENIIDEDYDL